MGLIYSYINMNNGNKKKDICFICDKKIKDIHCVLCKTCKNISHISCQLKQQKKNKCVQCNKKLTITCKK